MFHSNSTMSGFSATALFLACCMFPAMLAASTENGDSTPVFSPVVNGEALRGLSTIGSAESMGEGRIASTHVGLTSRKDFEDAIENLLEASNDVNAGSGAKRPDGS